MVEPIVEEPMPDPLFNYDDFAAPSDFGRAAGARGAFDEHFGGDPAPAFEAYSGADGVRAAWQDHANGGGGNNNNADDVYDHEEVCSRYRRYVRGQAPFPFWDPAKRRRYEALLRDDPKEAAAMKPDNGVLPGVHTQARGQTEDQLLEVRNDTRYLGRVNRRQREVELAGLKPGTEPYRVAYTQWQRAALDVFVDGIMDGPKMLWPRACVQSREWVKSLAVQTHEAPRLVKNLSSFGNFIVTLMDNFEVLFNFGHISVLALLARFVCLGAFRYVTSMRPALLLLGSMSSAKSYLQEAQGACMCPGVFKVATDATTLSFTGNEDEDCEILVVDEANGGMIGQRSDVGSTRDESIWKSIATDKIVKQRMLSVEDGMRKVVYTLSSHIGTSFLATNVELRNLGVSPMLQRYIPAMVDMVPAGEDHAIQDKMYRLKNCELGAEKRTLLTRLKLEAFETMVVEQAIGAGVISDVNLDPLVIYFEMFDRRMYQQGDAIEEAKRKKQVMETARTMVVAHAVSVAFHSEQTRSFRYEADGRTPRAFKDFLPQALRETERLLVATIDVAVFTFTLLKDLWASSDWPRICNDVRNNVIGLDSIRRLPDGRKASCIALDGAGPLPMADDMSSDYADLNLAAKLQSRVNHQVSLNARVMDNSDARGADVGAQSSASRHGGGGGFSLDGAFQLGGVVGGGGGGGGDMDRQDRQRQETELGQFISARVQIPFLVVRDAHTEEYRINPSYIEVRPRGAECTLENVAARIRGSQRGTQTSLENIKALIRRMMSEEIESRVFTYNVCKRTLELAPQHTEKRIKIPAVLKQRDTNAETQTNASGGWRYYFATELLVDDMTIDDMFESALDVLNREFTMPRNVLTALPVTAPRYVHKKRDGRWVESGRRVKFPEVLRVVRLEQAPGRSFAVTNYNRLRAGAARTLAVQQLGVGYDLQQLAAEIEMRRERQFATYRITIDPDIYSGQQHADDCGFPASERGLSVEYVRDLAELDTIQRNPDRFVQPTIDYPGDKIRELQQENRERYVAQTRPNCGNSRTMTSAAAGTPLVMDPLVRMAMERAGGQLLRLAEWDGRRATYPHRAAAAAAPAPANVADSDNDGDSRSVHFSGELPHEGFAEMASRARVPRSERDLFGAAQSSRRQPPPQARPSSSSSSPSASPHLSPSSSDSAKRKRGMFESDDERRKRRAYEQDIERLTNVFATTDDADAADDDEEGYFDEEIDSGGARSSSSRYAGARRSAPTVNRSFIDSLTGKGGLFGK